MALRLKTYHQMENLYRIEIKTFENAKKKKNGKICFSEICNYPTARISNIYIHNIVVFLLFFSLKFFKSFFFFFPLPWKHTFFSTPVEEIFSVFALFGFNFTHTSLLQYTRAHIHRHTLLLFDELLLIVYIFPCLSSFCNLDSFTVRYKLLCLL